MTTPIKLPLTVTTLYAELLDLSENDEALGYTTGHYTKKKIKGKTYWYLQYTIGKEQIQKYVGPETPELLEEINTRKQQNQDRISKQRATMPKNPRHPIP